MTIEPDGSVRLSGLAPWAAAVLYELDELLAPNQPERVRERLFPLPSDDEEHAEEWRKHVHPELFALVASARDVVRADLAAVRPPKDGRLGWTIDIPAAHVRAWVSALNAARLTLAELANLREEELEQDPEGLPGDRAPAALKVRLFGWIQELILEGLYPDSAS